MTAMSSSSREEWAAKAEYFVRTSCFPLERVPAGVEHYLTADEVAEMNRLEVELSAATRPAVSREITRLRALLPDRPKTRRGRQAWYLSLAETDRIFCGQLNELENVRTDLTRRIKGTQVRLRHNVFSVADLVPNQEALARLDQLSTKYSDLRDVAAEAATTLAVEAEIIRRQSDEAWAREQTRRARPNVSVSYVGSRSST